jgi:hypothetical protein
MNPKVKIGDRVMLVYMEDELDLSTKDKGTVTSVTRDPFETDECYIIGVDWDEGSSLSLLSCRDVYKLIKDKITENTEYQNSREEDQIDFLIKNRDIRKNFNRNLIFNYLDKLRESGVVNMYESPKFLYSGRDWIDRYYGENPPNQEAFEEVLEMADKVKSELINGVLKSINDLDGDDNDEYFRNLERLVYKVANRLATFWMLFY